jgi:DNA-directed RNA polymerase subunit RPC12/RpoP
MDTDEKIVEIERVRCLECGATYVKPSDGGTVTRNPGCPRCGYVGWILATIPPPPSDWLRSDEGRSPSRRAQLR